MQKQVDKSHYQFSRYVDKRRWASIWHQLDEVLTLNPRNVLEIGPGPGILKAVSQAFGVKVETLDLDPELSPDYVGSAEQMRFDDNSYDVVCAFQMLEHVPYERSLDVFREMSRVSNCDLIISLPDSRPAWPYSVHIPMKRGDVKFFLPVPWLGPRNHEFDGQHYWEVNKRGFTLKRIIKDLENVGCVSLKTTYRISENPFHRVFVFKKNKIVADRNIHKCSNR